MLQCVGEFYLFLDKNGNWRRRKWKRHGNNSTNRRTIETKRKKASSSQHSKSRIDCCCTTYEHIDGIRYFSAREFHCSITNAIHSHTQTHRHDRPDSIEGILFCLRWSHFLRRIKKSHGFIWPTHPTDDRIEEEKKRCLNGHHSAESRAQDKCE